MSMRATRHRLNFMVHRQWTWVDQKGNYGPRIRGSSCCPRMIRAKQHGVGHTLWVTGRKQPRNAKHWSFGPQESEWDRGGAMYTDHRNTYKRRHLPDNFKEIAEANGFSPMEMRGVWDIWNDDVGCRRKDYHRTKDRAWMVCYRDALDRIADSKKYGWNSTRK